MAVFRVDNDFARYIPVAKLIELLNQLPADSEVGVQTRPIVTGNLDIINGSKEGWLIGFVDLGDEVIEKGVRWKGSD